MMKKVEEAYANMRHWMEADFVLQLYSVAYKEKVIVYMQYPGEDSKTFVHDGREGTFTYVQIDGISKDPDTRDTLGILYDGDHYHYVEFI